MPVDINLFYLILFLLNTKGLIDKKEEFEEYAYKIISMSAMSCSWRLH